jgi:hypothetical protein
MTWRWSLPGCGISATKGSFLTQREKKVSQRRKVDPVVKVKSKNWPLIEAEKA